MPDRAGATVLARDAAVGLGEFLEDRGEFFGGNSEAGVADLNDGVDASAGGRQEIQFHDDLAGVGELDGVGQEIRDDLAHAQRIAEEVRMRSGICFKAEIDFLLRGLGRLRFDAILHHGARVEGDMFEHHLARFDLREVENIVQQREQRIGAALGGFELIFLLTADASIERQIEHAEQAVHGRAQLMRHVRQEFAFGLAGVEGAVHGPLQVLGALANAILKEFLMQADFFLGGGQRLDHAVEALTQVFDFIARAADLDGHQLALSHRGDAGFEQGERAGQQADGELRDEGADNPDDPEQNQTFSPVKGVLADIPP